MNQGRSKLNNLLPVHDLGKRNQNFSRGKKLPPLSCLQHLFPRVKTVDVRQGIKDIKIINKRIKTVNI